MITYCVHSPSLQRIKIGVAADLARRFRQLESAYGDDLVVVHQWFGVDARKLEAALHHHYRRDHVPPPPRWAEGSKTGDTEWFSERVLETVTTLNVHAVMKTFANVRTYTVKLDKDLVAELKRRGMTIEDAVRL